MIIVPDFIPDTNIWTKASGGNFNKGRTSIVMLVMHATVGSLDASRQHFRNKRSEVSAHYFVDYDGTVYQEVMDSDTAFHAGVSQWGPYTNVNRFSIGIELVNKNDGRDPYTQFDQAVELARILCQKYGIAENNLVRHSDVAPARKSDPKGLDWIAFKNAVYRGGTKVAPKPEPKPPSPVKPSPEPPKEKPVPPVEDDTGEVYGTDAIRGAISGMLVDFINQVIAKLRGG